MLDLAPAVGEAQDFWGVELQFSLVQLSLVALLVTSRSLSNPLTGIFGLR